MPGALEFVTSRLADRAELAIRWREQSHFEHILSQFESVLPQHRALFRLPTPSLFHEPCDRRLDP